MLETGFDKLLNITTIGEQKINNSNYYNIYEPTSYLALETLTSSFHISEDERIIDYGCGKGRLNFYLNYKFNCFVTGIEMNTYYFKEANNNIKSFSIKNHFNNDKINFLNILAQDYKVLDNDTIFYFFNPFTVHIFMKVISNIFKSLDNCYRKIYVILYYPLPDYIYYLDNNTSLFLEKEIKIPGLFEKDNNHRFLIYSNI